MQGENGVESAEKVSPKKMYMTSLNSIETVVLKVGTSSLVNHKTKCLNIAILAQLCETVQLLRMKGYSVVIVSSGAVGAGCMRSNKRSRPKSIIQRQAMAAIGQVALMRQYDDLFGALGICCAQVLLTVDNYYNRSQYLNACNTLQELIKEGVVPVVNENDTVAVDELRYGDNDSLSAFVANMVGATYLVLLTDVDAVYTSNPHKDPDAKPVRIVKNVSKLEMELKTQSQTNNGNSDSKSKESNGVSKKKIEKGEWGTGGMVTKLTAAKFATGCGIHVIIMSSLYMYKVPEVIQIWKEKQSVEMGTLFIPNSIKKLAAKQRWLLGLTSKGKIYLDAGAVGALLERKSIFAVGVKHFEGDFARNDIVTLCEYTEKKDQDGIHSHIKELARGKINYSSIEMNSIAGKKKEEIESIFGEASYIMDRENIVLLPHLKLDEKKGD